MRRLKIIMSIIFFHFFLFSCTPNSYSKSEEIENVVMEKNKKITGIVESNDSSDLWKNSKTLPDVLKKNSLYQFNYSNPENEFHLQAVVEDIDGKFRLYKVISQDDIPSIGAKSFKIPIRIFNIEFGDLEFGRNVNIYTRIKSKNSTVSKIQYDIQSLIQ